MPRNLDLLPTRHGGAAENMATDFMLLQRYPQSEYARFRHYGWQRPAFTFGYSQKIGFVRAQLPKDKPVELCRRPTGGGVVDHREDWTYALVLPRSHPAYDLRAVESYRLVHSCLQEALVNSGADAALLTECRPCGTAEERGPTVCFQCPELYDVIVPGSGEKIAGAAQKRNKHGLLFQGSIARSSVPANLDWEAFETHFIGALSRALGAEANSVGQPDWSDDELSQLTEQYSTADWNEFR